MKKQNIVDICVKCNKPIYSEDRKVNLVRDGSMFHSECFFEVFKQENVRIVTDMDGKKVMMIDIKEE